MTIRAQKGTKMPKRQRLRVTIQWLPITMKTSMARLRMAKSKKVNGAAHTTQLKPSPSQMSNTLGAFTVMMMHGQSTTTLGKQRRKNQVT